MITPTTATDVDLLREARTDAEAFGRFYRAYAERLYLWLLRETRDPQVATDLTAETFASALAGVASFRGTEPGTGVAWLFGIARNLLRRWHERRRVESTDRARLGMSVPSWIPSEVEEADRRLDAETLSARLRAAFDDLPEGLRETLRLHVLDGWSHGEVAAELGITEANARMRVTRGLRAIAVRVGLKEDQT